MHETVWTDAPRRNQNLAQTIQNYCQLTKPRMLPLFLITTAASMEIAAEGKVDPFLLLVTLVSGAFAAGSANTINCLYDRDIDYVMERTRHRPLPSGRLQPWEALTFAIALAGLAFILLALFANWLSACLAMAGIAVYVGVYTSWLKRSSTHSVVIGGAAGAIPPLVGWAAVTGTLSWPAWVLFAIILVWNPPHFWPLAMMMQDDYAEVNIPMLPVVAGDAITARQTFIYALILLPVTLLLVYPLHALGAVYCTIALALGGLFIQKAWQLLQTPNDRQTARSLFKYSIFYMMLLCAAMGLDSLPITHTVISALSDQVHGLATSFVK